MGLVPRTQSSIAVSADGSRWVIFNASPDIRQQIAANPELHPDPSGAARNSPIKAIVLTNGDVDHIAGLLSLRERQPYSLHATQRIHSILAANSIFEVLASGVVSREQILPGTAFEVCGLTVRPFDVPGKVPLFLEAENKTIAASGTGDTIGLAISSDGGDTIHYIPGCAGITEALISEVSGSQCLLFDGTLFADNELLLLQVGEKTGRRMGHVPISGEGGSMHAFDNAGCERKIYVHINTTNPILSPNSSAADAVANAAWEIAYDGLALTLN